MPNDAVSPLAIYISHLEKGELAYQFSPAANRAVFFPRVICPFTGSDRLEWRVSKGRGTVYATTIVHPAEGAPFNVALIASTSAGALPPINIGDAKISPAVDGVHASAYPISGR